MRSILCSRILTLKTCNPSIHKCSHASNISQRGLNKILKSQINMGHNMEYSHSKIFHRQRKQTKLITSWTNTSIPILNRKAQFMIHTPTNNSIVMTKAEEQSNFNDLSLTWNLLRNQTHHNSSRFNNTQAMVALYNKRIIKSL